MDHELEIKVNGKKLYQADLVKYLGINIDKNFTWNHHINNVATKISKANEILFKIRPCADIKTLRSIYHAIFKSHLS